MNILYVSNYLAQRILENSNYIFLWSITSLFLISSFFVNAQDFCTTPEISDNFIYEGVLQSANNNGPFYLKIYVHVVRDNNANGGQSAQNVEDAIAYLDEDFKSHNIFFVWDCEINYINDTYWYSGPLQSPTGIYSVNSHTDGIDIYLFPATANSPGGRANGVGGSSEFWVSGTWLAGNFPVAQSHIISHEMGHVLNLWHTHHSCETGGIWENTNGSNCAEAGDFVCDTPADPFLNWRVNPTTCQWEEVPYCNLPEPISNYDPDETNIMAYSPPDKCMSQFSLGQGTRMRNSIATLPYLQNTIISDVACGEEDLCAENNFNPQVFLEYPWIEQLISGYNCQEITIEVFKFTFWEFLNITFPANGNTPAAAKIYYKDGTFWCKKRPDLDCKAYYGLNTATNITCGCNQSCTGGSCPTTCEQRDKNTLLALYSSTNGQYWNTTWDIDQRIATWQGVTLDNEGCVKVLNLPNNGLSGTLPAEIGSLNKLTYLNLSNNQIGGNIPNSVGNLTNVGIIDFSNNQFNGAISENLSTLPILTFLYLEYNELSGSIPASFSNMENLGYLYVNNNQLSGDYPPNLQILCAQLLNSSNETISNGNNFNQNWETFCFGDSEDIDLVWPGDLNNDSVVDYADHLFWGVATGTTGPSRSNATTIWVGQAAPDWASFYEGVNGKHQDANGDGTVDYIDLSVVADNLGETTNNNSASLQSIEPIEVYFNVAPIDPDQVNRIQPLQLFIEDLDGLSITAHGICGTIYFSNNAVINAFLSVDGSSLNPNANYILEQYNSTNNSLSFALTRTDGNNVVCNDFIATINMVIDSSVEEKIDIPIQFDSGKLIRSNGETKNIANSTFTISTSFIDESSSFNATAYVTHQQCKSLGKAVIDVYGGTPPYYYQWNTGVNFNGFTTHTYDHLLPGAYEVTITDNTGDSETLSIIINAQEPIYDANGALICGSECEAYVNPTGNVSTGVVQAKQLLESNASIQQNSNVEFTAGERIRLNSNFSTKQNAAFRAAIEDCN